MQGTETPELYPHGAVVGVALAPPRQHFWCWHWEGGRPGECCGPNNKLRCGVLVDCAESPSSPVPSALGWVSLLGRETAQGMELASWSYTGGELCSETGPWCGQSTPGGAAWRTPNPHTATWVLPCLRDTEQATPLPLIPKGLYFMESLTHVQVGCLGVVA